LAPPLSTAQVRTISALTANLLVVDPASAAEASAAIPASAAATSSTQTSGSGWSPAPKPMQWLSRLQYPSPECCGGVPAPSTTPGRAITSGSPRSSCIRKSAFSAAIFARA